jgi:hypothetical protein
LRHLENQAFAKRASYKLDFVVWISSSEEVTLVPKQFIIMVPFAMASKLIIESWDVCYIPRQVLDLG